MLRNSCPYTIYPTFSFPPMEGHISPLTNSSLHWTDSRTHPHSSPMPCTSETQSVPINRYVSLFHLSRPDPFHSSTGPSVRWSPFSSSYVFPLESAAALHPLRSTGPPFRFPFLHRTSLCFMFSLVQRSGSLP